MNTKILQKCLEELDKETPRLDYIRGMLETLVSMDEPVSYKKDEKGYIVPVTPTAKPKTETQDEGEILTAQAKARLAAVKELSDKSTEIS
jgi:hypothetical protein